MNNKLSPEQEKLVTDNMRLVYYLFGKLRYNEFKQSHGDDFISEGLIGLIKAAKTFDPERGAKFATYASRCINNQFFMYLRHLRNKDGVLVSFSTPVAGTDGLTLEDMLCDESAQAEIDSILTQSVVNQVLEKASNQDKKIFGLRQQGHTQKEVASEIGISQSYVSRRYKNIKTKLGKHIKGEAYAT